MKSEGSDQFLSEQRENRNASVLAYRRESSSVCDDSKGEGRGRGGSVEQLLDARESNTQCHPRQGLAQLATTAALLGFTAFSWRSYRQWQAVTTLRAGSDQISKLDSLLGSH